MIVRNVPVVDFVFVLSDKFYDVIFVVLIPAVDHYDFSVFGYEHKPFGLIFFGFDNRHFNAAEHIFRRINVVRHGNIRKVNIVVFSLFKADEHAFFAFLYINFGVENKVLPFVDFKLPVDYVSFVIHNVRVRIPVRSFRLETYSRLDMNFVARVFLIQFGKREPYARKTVVFGLNFNGVFVIVAVSVDNARRIDRTRDIFFFHRFILFLIRRKRRRERNYGNAERDRKA